MTKPNVLITGGSGYMGQFLVHALARERQVHYTYGTRKLSSAPEGVVAHQVDLKTGEGLRHAFEQVTFHAVVNCAALSQPALCEANPEAARSVNVPAHLVDCLLRQEGERGVAALLVHFSTDQVYDGSHAQWREDERCEPVNAYGRSKLEAEQLILSRLPEAFPVVILRSSIIFGPPPPDPVPRPLFLQFVADAVRGTKPTTFFEDEWRSPVYVADLTRLVEGLIAGVVYKAATAAADSGVARSEQAKQAAAAAVESEALAAGPLRPRHRVYNTGGPERLSRLDMARQVADALGCGYDSIAAVPSVSVSRPVASPADISMDTSRLRRELGFVTTPFRQALRDILAAEAKPKAWRLQAGR